MQVWRNENVLVSFRMAAVPYRIYEDAVQYAFRKRNEALVWMILVYMDGWIFVLMLSTQDPDVIDFFVQVGDVPTFPHPRPPFPLRRSRPTGPLMLSSTYRTSHTSHPLFSHRVLPITPASSAICPPSPLEVGRTRRVSRR